VYRVKLHPLRWQPVKALRSAPLIRRPRPDIIVEAFKEEREMAMVPRIFGTRFCGTDQSIVNFELR
jgi:hypothetical protein